MQVSEIIPKKPFQFQVNDHHSRPRTATFVETKTGGVHKSEGTRHLQCKYELLATKAYKRSDRARGLAEGEPYGADGERKGELYKEKFHLSPVVQCRHNLAAPRVEDTARWGKKDRYTPGVGLFISPGLVD